MITHITSIAVVVAAVGCLRTRKTLQPCPVTLKVRDSTGERRHPSVVTKGSRTEKKGTGTKSSNYKHEHCCASKAQNTNIPHPAGDFCKAQNCSDLQQCDMCALNCRESGNAKITPPSVYCLLTLWIACCTWLFFDLGATAPATTPRDGKAAADDSRNPFPSSLQNTTRIPRTHVPKKHV